MRLSKFLSVTTLVTFLSLAYVWQQTEIFRLAYAGQKRLTRYEDLLDKNNILRYTIGQNASLVQIGKKISATKEFQMPDTYRLVRLAPQGRIRVTEQPSNNKESLVARVFGVTRQAEAKTLSP